jgi:hypothetical protein
MYNKGESMKKLLFVLILMLVPIRLSAIVYMIFYEPCEDTGWAQFYMTSTWVGFASKYQEKAGKNLFVSDCAAEHGEWVLWKLNVSLSLGQEMHYVFGAGIDQKAARLDAQNNSFVLIDRNNWGTYTTQEYAHGSF